MQIKEIIRKYIPKSIRYRNYCKALKNKNRKLVEEIIEYYKNTTDSEMEELINYISKNGVEWFNYDFKRKYIFREPVKIYFDSDVGLKYLFHGDKRMYFKRGMSDEEIWGYYNNISMEQDKDSPHCYLNGKFEECKDKVIFDCGGAEGNFTLDVIEYIQHSYIFECDEEWIEALEATFGEYKDKITIIPQILAGEHKKGCVTVKDIIDKYSISEIDIIKMDIEGMETEVIESNKEILEQFAPTLFVCTYHNQDDYDNIYKILSDLNYNIEKPQGYFLWMSDPNLCEPWFRRCVLKARKYALSKNAIEVN